MVTPNTGQQGERTAPALCTPRPEERAFTLVTNRGARLRAVGASGEAARGGQMTAVECRAHLRRQLDFLARSCGSFDQGLTNEAVGIATAIRVILHDAHPAASLLTQLDAWHIHLLSTCHEASPFAVVFSSLGIQENGPHPGPLRPNLGDDETFLLPAAEWWNQVVFILDTGTRVRRRDLALVAASKDGGARVYPDVPPEYERLAEDGALVSCGGELDGAKAVLPAKTAHFVALRTMGWELLNSPDLIHLANEGAE